MHELSGRGQEKVVLLSKFKFTASWELDCGESSTPYVSWERLGREGGTWRCWHLLVGEVWGGERTERLRPATLPARCLWHLHPPAHLVVTALDQASSFLIRTMAPAPNWPPTAGSRLRFTP